MTALILDLTNQDYFIKSKPQNTSPGHLVFLVLDGDNMRINIQYQKGKMSWGRECKITWL